MRVFIIMNALKKKRDENEVPFEFIRRKIEILELSRRHRNIIRIINKQRTYGTVFLHRGQQRKYRKIRFLERGGAVV